MKWKRLSRTIYPVTIYFAQGGTVAEIKAKLKRLKLTPDEGEERKFVRGKQLGWTLKMTGKDSKFALLVWVEKCSRNPKNVSFIAHECLHVVYNTFEYIGMQMPVNEDSETATYFLDYLVREALGFYWRPQLNDVSL